jgi:uncharacterized protein YjiS (DUF1127 family)
MKTLQERLMTRAHLISTADRDTATLTARAGRRIAKAWHAYWQRRAKRVTVALLDSLDDRTLHDIGVGRSEIPFIVYGRHGDRTRSYDEAWRLFYAGR